MIRTLLLLGSVAVASWAAAAEAPQHSLTIAIQESGTALWELQAIDLLGLDEEHDLEIRLRHVADSRAGQIALQSGAVDVILSDFVWVSTQRHRGNRLTMVPHSLAVGALMAPEGGEVAAVTDLPGQTIAIAGGPVDKSWVILQAYYREQTGEVLTERVHERYGAPPLVNELLLGGRAGAAMNYWHWNARATAAGAVEVISVAEMLAALGVPETPPLLGWTFSDETAEQKSEALRAFLDASFAAKAMLAQDDAVWEALRPAMRAEGDEALFIALREGYRAGIVTAYDPTATAAAEATFALLAEHGGTELVGEGDALAPGTFWDGYSLP
ncbi:MAG TPA: ABC transporter substrate-binding protein [Devosiaceae bacterium]|jgi:NitT/TauT family transport system substrate-binding protein|nr:ABC transporter substrate-binding protein [Devosiaceae bacterium]